MIGVDFGGTRIKAARVEAGTVLELQVRDTPAESPARVIETIVEAVGALGLRSETLGVAIPGEVDAAGRVVRLPNVPGFEGVRIAEELSLRLGARVVIENDSTSAALGERLFGFGKDYPSFLLVTLGTGIGGGIVLDGRVRRGAHGFAGEIGHLVIDSSPDAPLCVCQQRGCLEVRAGTLGLLRRYAELGKAAREVKTIGLGAARGEPEALEVFRGMGQALGFGIAQIQKILDLDAVIFSGGISRSFAFIEPSLRAALQDHAHAPPLAEIPLRVSELGEHAGVIGAAHLPELTA